MPSGVPVLQVQLQAPPAKPWWRSRTLWANVLVLLLAAAETQMNVLQPLLPVNVYALVAFALPVMNVALRAITAQALALRAPVKPEATPAAPPPGGQP